MPVSTPPASDPLSPADPLVTTLAQARKQLHMTQADLATQAGLSRMTVQRLESNGLDPRLSTLHEMARVLGYELLAIPQHLSGEVHAVLQRHQPPATPGPAAHAPHSQTV